MLWSQAPLRRLVEGLASTESTSFLNPSARQAAASHVMVAKREAQAIVVDFLNLVLGVGPKSIDYWRQVIEPCAQAMFNYSLSPSSRLAAAHTPGSEVRAAADSVSIASVSASTTTALYKAQLFIAVQDACGARVCLTQLESSGSSARVVLKRSRPLVTVFDVFESVSPLTVADVLPATPTSRSIRIACGNKPLECFAVATSADELFNSKEFYGSLQAYNLRLAMLQAQGDSHSIGAVNALIGISKSLLQLVSC